MFLKLNVLHLSFHSEGTCSAQSSSTINLVASQTKNQTSLTAHPSMTCSVAITATGGSQVKFVLVTTRLQKAENCTGDKVIVYDGPNESSKQVLQLCFSSASHIRITAAYSTGTQALLVFKTDSNNTTVPSLVINYEAVTPLPGIVGKCDKSDIVNGANYLTVLILFHNSLFQE